MMLNKELYTNLENTLKTENESKKKDDLQSFAKELLYELTTLFIINNRDELEKELHLSKRFEKLLLNNEISDISRQIGVIIGILMTMEMISHKTAVKNKINKNMSAVFMKEINKKILFYLYDHPNSQHKIIAEAIGIRSNYLSQQMRELEETGGVVRHSIDRRSFYELSLDGQAFVEERKHDSGFYSYTDNFAGITNLTTWAPSFQYNLFAEEKPKMAIVKGYAAGPMASVQKKNKDEKELLNIK